MAQAFLLFMDATCSLLHQLFYYRLSGDYDNPLVR